MDHVACRTAEAVSGPNGEPLYRCVGGHLHAFPLAAEFCASPIAYELEVEANAQKLASSASGSAA